MVVQGDDRRSMSRSRKRTPICGNTMADSEKKDKQLANRTYRSRVRTAIRSNWGREDIDDIADSVLPVDGEWEFDKDGKHYHICNDRCGGGCHRK